MTDRWESIQRVVITALGIDHDRREAFVREQCGDDLEMVSDVLSLLAKDEATSVLDGSLADIWMPPTRSYVGRQLGHYEVKEKLASGGMGVVYKAVDKKLDRTIALKFLHPHLGFDPKARARLIREARTASSLDHPNICTVYEVGETSEDDVFIAMAFYDGSTLDKMLSSGLLDQAAVLDIVSQVSTGLSHAHAAGISHRDIKPANLLVTESGLVKILDFGIAKPESGTTTLTGTVGTLAYMSPEQLDGIPPDPRTDIWSLGVVFFEMLAGER
ncbi:MAG: serine/threonine protein kinase, partial [Rhodothermia bacterium]|nr:serine/threonine protein kinase [Rhodothermia bacterium]